MAAARARRREAMRSANDPQWVSRWVDYTGRFRGRAAMCFANGDTCRDIYGPSQRSGFFPLARTLWWCWRNGYVGLPVHRVPEGQW